MGAQKVLEGAPTKPRGKDEEEVGGAMGGAQHVWAAGYSSWSVTRGIAAAT